MTDRRERRLFRTADLAWLARETGEHRLADLIERHPRAVEPYLGRLEEPLRPHLDMQRELDKWAALYGASSRFRKNFKVREYLTDSGRPAIHLEFSGTVQGHNMSGSRAGPLHSSESKMDALRYYLTEIAAFHLLKPRSTSRRSR